jgi:hypothetical protein
MPNPQPPSLCAHDKGEEKKKKKPERRKKQKELKR